MYLSQMAGLNDKKVSRRVIHLKYSFVSAEKTHLVTVVTLRSDANKHLVHSRGEKNLELRENIKINSVPDLKPEQLLQHIKINIQMTMH